MSSENKFSTENIQPDAQGAAAAEEMEREAKAGNDITTYTHRFSDPFTFHIITKDAIKDATVDALTFKRGTLTGADYLEIEDEVLMHGKTLVVPAFTGLFLCGMAVRACTLRNEDGTRTLDARALKSMPIRDFQTVIQSARSFLQRAGSRPARTDSGSASNT